MSLRDPSRTPWLHDPAYWRDGKSGDQSEYAEMLAQSLQDQRRVVFAEENWKINKHRRREEPANVSRVYFDRDDGDSAEWVPRERGSICISKLRRRKLTNAEPLPNRALLH